MTKKWDTCYLDWDGVIWDFMTAFCEWLGYEVPEACKWEFYEELSMTKTYFEEILAGLPQEFWQQEKYIMPHAQDLVAWARRNAENVSILTVAPEWTTAQGKQNLARKHFDLGVYAVACAKDKVEFAKEGYLLIDDKPSSVVSFANEYPLSDGYVWPTKYNGGMVISRYFQRYWIDQDKMNSTKDETKEGENMKPTNPKDIAGSSKVPMNSMLSGAVMGEVALALFEGALKYGRHNYRQDGVRASVYYDAVGRHLAAWWEGEDIDEESGLSHITKAIAGLHILRDCSIRGMCNDDRPPKTADFMKELNYKTKALINKYPDPVPPVLEKGQGECVLEAKPYVEDANSYTEYSDGSRSFTREFSLESGNLGEFEWHRDHYDRRVRLVEGKDWYIQFEGEHPVLITSDFITIKKGEEHRLIAPLGVASRDLKVEVFEHPDGIPEQSGCCGTGGCC